MIVGGPTLKELFDVEATRAEFIFAELILWILLEFAKISSAKVFQNQPSTKKGRRNADFGHFWPCSLYVTKGNILVLTPHLLRNES